LSEAAAVHLHKDPGVTAVVIRYIAPESWFVGGDSLTGQGLKSFHLDIKVGAVRNAVGIRYGVFPGNMKLSFQAARSIG
jgi:hypothetical protein